MIFWQYHRLLNQYSKVADHNLGGKVQNMKKYKMLVIKLVHDFYLKCMYLAIGPKQNCHFKYKGMIFCQRLSYQNNIPWYSGLN